MNKDINKELIDILVELGNSHFYEAIKAYNRKADSNILVSLASIDPFKDPTLLARNQGLRIGMYQLEKDIDAEKKRREDLSKGGGDQPETIAGIPFNG